MFESLFKKSKMVKEVNIVNAIKSIKKLNKFDVNYLKSVTINQNDIKISTKYHIINKLSQSQYSHAYFHNNQVFHKLL